MAYDEEQTRRTTVVETPTARREVVQTEQYETGRTSTSIAMVAVMAVALAAVVGLLFVFFMTRPGIDQNTANQGTQQQPATTIVEQPAQQPTVIVQQPAPASQPAPVVINPLGGAAPAVPDDANIQAEIGARLAKDAVLSTLDVAAVVQDHKVTLTGKVNTDPLKHQVEKLVWAVKGVKAVDNQLVVQEA